VLFVGYFVLEGFDYGVGMLLPFLGRGDRERRMILNSIGTFWDGNEVWLLTAGGAIFAAFPNWYATMFSGFYLPLFLILLGLIVRGVGFEFRSKDKHPAWRATWDWMVAVGSLIPALIFGVAVGNLLRGVPIDAHMTYTGGFWNLLNPFALVTGVTFVLLFALHGALFLTLRTSGPVLARAQAAARGLWLPTVCLAVSLLSLSYVMTGMFKGGAAGWLLGGAAAVTLLLSGALARARPGTAFAMTALTILLVTVAAFRAMFPNVMISTLDPKWSLTIYNASSSPYTLKIMTFVAATMVPIVLAYQGWTYWIFRKRLTDQSPMEY
jgi:cytochrome bd ubiquinol oxidase subunit II